jgi:hypothetical protein
VQLPKPEAFNGREDYYSTQFHELAHAIGHRSRLNRFEDLANSASFGSPSYARKELLAEMTAAMICGVLGIDPVKVEAISPVGGGEELREGSAARGRPTAEGSRGTVYQKLKEQGLNLARFNPCASTGSSAAPSRIRTSCPDFERFTPQTGGPETRSGLGISCCRAWPCLCNIASGRRTHKDSRVIARDRPWELKRTCEIRRHNEERRVL